MNLQGMIETVREFLTAASFESLFLLMLAPLFLLTIAVEVGFLARRQRLGGTYALRDSIGNAGLALSHAVVDAVCWAGLIVLFRFVWEHCLLEIPVNVATVALLWLMQDFLYYWFHRASHRIRWMWASHVVHHSSELMNFTTAFRQSLTYQLSGMWVFWLPLAWLGFLPEHVLLVVAVNLAYQFFIHTQAVDKLPRRIEGIINTPSHHRVHHARNAQYIDKNFGDTLIIWDKLFGSFVEEREPCDFGITRQIRTNNLLVMIFHEWIDMFRDVLRHGPIALRLKHLWGPPEFTRPDVDQPEPAHGEIISQQA